MKIKENNDKNKNILYRYILFLYQMHQTNHFRNQLASTLNPHCIYQYPFQYQNHTTPNKAQNQELQKQIFTHTSTQTTLKQKEKFLTIVTKSKKYPKNKKSNQKTLLKRSNSVILGGPKKNTSSSIKKNQNSLKLSKSCVNLNKSNEHNLVNQNQTYLKFCDSPLRPKLMISNSLHPNQNSYSHVISHKLKMNAMRPHLFPNQKSGLNITGKNNNNNLGNNEKKIIRNITSESFQIVKFETPQIKENEITQKSNYLIDTKREGQVTNIQQQSLKKRRKSRQNVGFIYSARSDRILPFESTIIKQQQKTADIQLMKKTVQSQKGLHNLQQNPTSTTKNNEQIDQCITKMNNIRKQIDEIQKMIGKRLELTELKSKFTYNSIRLQNTTNYNNEAKKPPRQNQPGSSTERIGVMGISQPENFNRSKSIDKPISHTQNYRSTISITNSIVHGLDNLSQSLNKSKYFLMQSSGVYDKKALINNDGLKSCNSNSVNIHNRNSQRGSSFEKNKNHQSYYSIQNTINDKNQFSLEQINKLIIKGPQLTNYQTISQNLMAQYISKKSLPSEKSLNHLSNLNQTNSTLIKCPSTQLKFSNSPSKKYPQSDTNCNSSINTIR